MVSLHFHLVFYTMASKLPSTSSQESDSKKSRKTVNIEKKLEVLDRYARGEKTLVIVHATVLKESMLNTIVANRMRMCVFIVFVT
ncbi:hypothetical protein E2C01_090335 [Portunus trituberculatus]|uniref:Uncharacterized protein n=1 Tax=Portunus trituberculatus TaxID=210409 RepID=A0A5B7JJZ6_PORTR|nr:hypothetical protein [Portunus trituberculatus]